MPASRYKKPSPQMPPFPEPPPLPEPPYSGGRTVEDFEKPDYSFKFGKKIDYGFKPGGEELDINYLDNMMNPEEIKEYYRYHFDPGRLGLYNLIRSKMGGRFGRRSGKLRRYMKDREAAEKNIAARERYEEGKNMQDIEYYLDKMRESLANFDRE